jgi:uncharacterized membrane protein
MVVLFLLTPHGSHGNAGDPSPLVVLLIIGVSLVFMVLVAVASVPFMFTYPLIIDKGLGGIEAIKVSARAALAHFGGLIGLALVLMALGFAGVFCCYVGAFLVMPISFGAQMIAYERIFGLSEKSPAAVS